MVNSGLRSRVRERTDHRLHSRSNFIQRLKQLWCFLELGEHVEVGPDLAPRQLSARLEDDTLDINPILRSCGKCLVHDEIFRRIGAQRRTTHQFDNAAVEFGDQRGRVLGFVAEPRQQREIEFVREARRTPAEIGDPADEQNAQSRCSNSC